MELAISFLLANFAKVILVRFFIPDFNLLSCQLDKSMFKQLY